MSKLCGLCNEKHQATHYCIECQEFLCGMLADVHTKLKSTKAHILQDANPTADIQSKIDKALQEIQQARSDIFVQYADAVPPRNWTSQLAVQRANQVFAAFINMGVLLNHQHDSLVDMQQSLPRMDHNALVSVASSPLFKPDTTALQRYIASLPPFINTFGSVGDQEGCFNKALDVAVSPMGEVYVCDSYKDRVQVFTPDGKFLRMWGLPRQPNSWPIAMSVAPWGDVYIANSNSAYVSRFHPNGHLLRTWDFEPADCQILDVAASMSDREEVFVLTVGVRVYTKDGNFLRFWHVPRDSQSLCVGPDHRVYVITPLVCQVFDEFGNKKAVWGGLANAKKVTVHGSLLFVAEETGVRVFRTSGVYLGTLGHAKAPKAVALNAKQAYICESHSVEIVELSVEMSNS